MASDFVHLHLHTHYSLLDGACTVKGLIEQAKLYDMPAVAMTDHGYMGGTQDMYQNFTKAGLKPIIGCEAYVSPTTRFDRNPSNPRIRGYHLVLLAKNMDGYHSLCKLLSEAYINGMYYKPRIDKEILQQYHEGLIALSACIGGEVPSAVLNDDMAEAERLIGEYCEIMGRDNFYLELMDHGMPEERKVNRALVEFSRKLDLPLVATNDVHYLKKEHAKAHEIMLCIQTQAKLDDPKHFRFSAPEFYFKSPEEMKALFKELPEAITNTRAVAERCEIEFKYAPHVNHYPVFNIPDPAVSEKEYLRNFCIEGIKQRYGFDPRSENLTDFQKTVVERMDYELNIIDGSKYCSYFLVVSDFIRYAKSQDIPVGPGRGSGAGSLVAYATGITDIEPLRFNLLFERFLNPERVSPPDFDIDFCEQRRGEVIDYVRNKYGHDSVAQICTYGTLKAKAVIKDVARVLGHDFEHGDRITKLIPADPKMTLAKARKESKELNELIEKEDWVKEIFSYAEVLEGINRQLGIHAAGVIIGDQRLDNLVPLARGAKNEIITEFPSVPCEELGLLKMDFLGLRTLTIIHNAVNLIRKSRGFHLDISNIPLDDPKTYELLNRGDTVAVFQLESTGMQNLCRQFGVETIEHIIALLAIYRPGPMQFIPQFIARKRGDEEIVYENPKMEPLLKETYGIMLYQEQIMQVVQVLAGFSLGGADILRRAIGKKKADVLAQQKAKFVAGCAEHSGINEAVANAIWDKIEMFAGYGFNKSHSAAYAIVAYRTAYLKANYPVEFMAAMLTSELDNAEEIAFLINACREMHIKVLPPDVNASDISFGVSNGSIVFGLGAIKGVGEAAAGRIIEARESEGAFKDFTDFCERCGDALNSRMIEHLTRAGAFDSLGLRRSQILAIAEPTMSYAAGRIKDRQSGQGSLFDLLDDGDKAEICTIPVPDIPEFDPDEILKSEKELLGFYVTGHPLARYAELINTMSTLKLRNLDQLGDNVGVRIGGMIKSVQKKYSKNNNKPFMVLTLEDLDHSAECMIYERGIERLEQSGIELTPEMPIFIEALSSRRDESEKPRLIIENVVTMQQAPELYTEELLLYLYEKNTDAALLDHLKALCLEYRGETRVILCVSCPEPQERVVFVEVRAFTVRVCFELLERLTSLLGEQCYKLKPNKKVPEARARNWTPRPVMQN